MSLELGAISKGFIADQVKAYFEEKGISTAIINLGAMWWSWVAHPTRKMVGRWGFRTLIR